MATTTSPAVNHWYDKRCARAYWSQGEIAPYRELLLDTAAWVDPSPGQHWIDLGCGMGRLTRMVWEKSGGTLGSLVALDCAAENERAIAAYRDERCIPADRVRFVQADFSDGLQAIEADSLDGAVSGLAIQYAHHWCDATQAWTTRAYDRLLGEVCRVLRPGGAFVFSVNVPNPNWVRVGFQSFFDFFTSPRPDKLLRNGLRMMGYGWWLKQEAAKGRFHYLEHGVVTAKLGAAGFVAVEHRVSFAGQAYVFRARKPM